MSSDVKPVALTRAEATEERIVAAATELFIEHGYRGTTMSDVARAAGVSDRTVYVRFATKADLLKRAIDVAVVGDTRRIGLSRRDWVLTAMGAPTLEERLKADAAGTTELFARLAPLVGVAVQVEADEPLIAESARAGRDGTLAHQHRFWTNLRAAGLMNPDSDLDWVIATAGLLGDSETYLHMTRITTWTSEDYERWRYRTWWLLATTPGPPMDLPVT
jgi:AcrR family transcriptional regulator